MRVAQAATIIVALTSMESSALAHPHVQVDASIEPLFDREGKLAGIRQSWHFDADFSALATQGADTNGDGILDKDELSSLAKINIESLKEYSYFTNIKIDTKVVTLGVPTGAIVEYSDDSALTLSFVLPLMPSLDLREGGAEIELYDPDYFIDFRLKKSNPVKLTGTPSGCSLIMYPKSDPAPQFAAMLARLPATAHTLTPELQAVTKALANRLVIACPK